MFFDEHYLRLCSEKTLQSNKEGFFLQFVENVIQQVGPNWIKKFGKLKTDLDRIKKIYEDKQINSLVIDFLKNVQVIYRKKDPEAAKTRLQEAREALKIGDKKKSLALYSQSILKNPQNVAFLERAKLLISLNEYSNALSDLQISLKEKLPENFKFEAFWMMTICYKALNEENRMKIALNLTEKLIENNNKLKEMLHKSLEKQYEAKKTETKEITNVKNKISVKKSPDLGRFIVASEEIKSGETLVVEEPEVACLYPEKYGTHCHNCFNRLLAPIGCPDCVGVAFCSSICRDTAISSYHKYECKFLDLLIGSGMSVLSLAALRSITQKQTPKKFSFCTNSHQRKAEDFLQRTLMAVFLLRCLQKSNFFGKNETIIPTETEYQIGETILHNLQVLQFNAHEIYETISDSTKTKTNYLGVALYPTVALFNHECYPAVTRFFVGTKIVVKSLRPLKSGCLIGENYGPVFTHHSLIERQRSLSGRYWFNCKCSACLENWPTLNNSTDVIERIRCSNKDCCCIFSNSNQQCPKCNIEAEKQLEKIHSILEQYEKGYKLIQEKKTQEAIEILTDALNTFNEVSRAPHKATHLAEEALRTCFTKSGNIYEF